MELKIKSLTNFCVKLEHLTMKLKKAKFKMQPLFKHQMVKLNLKMMSVEETSLKPLEVEMGNVFKKIKKHILNFILKLSVVQN